MRGTSSAGWPQSGNDSCASAQHLVCFEQSPLPVAPPPSATKKRVFITSNKFNGNLGGLAGADEKCMQAATAGNKAGMWKAYLSSSTESALSRMAEVGPWYQETSDGTYLKTFNNKTNLTTYPLEELSVDEQGAGAVVHDVRYAPWFWSATYLDGTIATANCRDWTSASSLDDGMRGNSFRRGIFTLGWPQSGNDSCSSVQRLVCFEQ